MGTTDLGERKQLRDNLQCLNFQWFLDYVYPDAPFPSVGTASSPSTGWDWEAIRTCSKQGKKESHKVGQGNKPQYP